MLTRVHLRDSGKTPFLWQWTEWLSQFPTVSTSIGFGEWKVQLVVLDQADRKTNPAELGSSFPILMLPIEKGADPVL